jgi:hypothetical protein
MKLAGAELFLLPDHIEGIYQGQAALFEQVCPLSNTYYE